MTPSPIAWRTTAHNVAVLAAAARACDVLAAAGVACALFKGAALLGTHYALDERPTGDVDLLIVRRDRQRAAAALVAAGFGERPALAGPTARAAWPSRTYLGPAGVQLDVHVDLGAWPRYRLDVEGVLARALPHPEAGAAARRACDTDLALLLALDHAKDDGKRKPLRQEDLARLCAAGALDWAALAARARATGVACALWHDLDALIRARPALENQLDRAVVHQLRPAAPRRILAQRLLDDDATSPLTWSVRLGAGVVATDSLLRYGAALGVYGGRRLVDALIVASRRSRSDGSTAAGDDSAGGSGRSA